MILTHKQIMAKMAEAAARRNAGANNEVKDVSEPVAPIKAPEAAVQPKESKFISDSDAAKVYDKAASEYTPEKGTISYADDVNDDMRNKIMSQLTELGYDKEGSNLPKDFEPFLMNDAYKGAIPFVDSNSRFMYLMPGKADADGMTDYSYGSVLGENDYTPFEIGRFSAKAPEKYDYKGIASVLPTSYGKLSSITTPPYKRFFKGDIEKPYIDNERIGRPVFSFAPISPADYIMGATNRRRLPVTEKRDGGLVPLTDEEKEKNAELIANPIEGAHIPTEFVPLKQNDPVHNDIIHSSVNVSDAEKRKTDIKNRVRRRINELNNEESDGIKNLTKYQGGRKTEPEQGDISGLAELADTGKRQRIREIGAKEVAGYPSVDHAKYLGGYDDAELEKWGNSVLDGKVLRSESISDFVNTRFEKAVKERSSF